MSDKSANKSAVKIDKEFAKLMPILTPDEFSQLEQNIKTVGRAINPLMVWEEEDLLIDGHNRYAICEKLSLPYTVETLSFPNRAAVMSWIITNDNGRRHKNAFQRIEAALKLEKVFADQAKARQKAAGGAKPKKSSEPTGDTRDEIARIAGGASAQTVDRVKRILEKGTTALINACRIGEESINSAWQQVKPEKTETEKAASKTSRGARTPEGPPTTATKPTMAEAIAPIETLATDTAAGVVHVPATVEKPKGTPWMAGDIEPTTEPDSGPVNEELLFQAFDEIDNYLEFVLLNIAGLSKEWTDDLKRRIENVDDELQDIVEKLPPVSDTTPAEPPAKPPAKPELAEAS
jgi:ParB-like chromosome segregation protein Spo0J